VGNRALAQPARRCQQWTRDHIQQSPYYLCEARFKLEKKTNLHSGEL